VLGLKWSHSAVILAGGKQKRLFPPPPLPAVILAVARLWMTRDPQIPPLKVVLSLPRRGCRLGIARRDSTQFVVSAFLLPSAFALFSCTSRVEDGKGVNVRYHCAKILAALLPCFWPGSSSSTGTRTAGEGRRPSLSPAVFGLFRCAPHQHAQISLQDTVVSVTCLLITIFDKVCVEKSRGATHLPISSMPAR